MDVLIWGDFKAGHDAKKIIESKVSDVNCIGFVDRDKKKKKSEPYLVADYQQMLVLYKKRIAEKIVIPSFYERNLFRDIIYTVGKLDIDKEDIIVPPIELFFEERSFSADEFLVEWYRARQIDYIEFATTDFCNLNCKGCARFAPLANKEIYNHEEVKNSFRRLKKYISHINMIRILGGEPFLDPDIEDYFVFLRELYPYSEIRVVSNGLLLQSTKAETFAAMRDNNVGLDMSYYPPLSERIDTIREKLGQEGIDYKIESGEVFYKSFNLCSDDNVRQKKEECRQWCISLRNGFIYPCATSATVDYFKKTFSVNIPSNEGMDLFGETMSTERIKDYLSKPIGLCRYCDFTKMSL